MAEVRSTELELLGRGAGDANEVARSLRFCRMVNRFFGGTRVVRKFVEDELARTPPDRTLRLLDIGSGDCSIPLAVSRWAARRGRHVEFVCLENNPHAVRFARQAVEAAGVPRIRVVEGDILTHQPDEPYDCAIGSLFFHHFTGDEILALLGRLRGFVRRSVLINDLRNRPAHYLACLVLAPFLSPDVRHDALLSIRRGFSPRGLRELLGHLENVLMSVEARWFQRVAGVVRFDAGD